LRRVSRGATTPDRMMVRYEGGWLPLEECFGQAAGSPEPIIRSMSRSDPAGRIHRCLAAALVAWMISRIDHLSR
jgi:hypothetical protein